MSEHDWLYGHCLKCGYCTDTAGGSNEDAPPCTGDADELEARVEKLESELAELRKVVARIGVQVVEKVKKDR